VTTSEYLLLYVFSFCLFILFSGKNGGTVQ
jgi:hypothetical protein